MNSFLDIDCLQSKHLQNFHDIFFSDELSQILQLIQQKFNLPNKDLIKWFDLYSKLPSVNPGKINLNGDVVSMQALDNNYIDRHQLTELLQGFHPWRQGPYDFCGVHIDSEWQSQFKWQRIQSSLSLEGKSVLDIGCGNGYYSWRALGAGAQKVIGLEPSLRSVIQFLIFQKYIKSTRIAVFPFRLEEFSFGRKSFDVIFSMGVLYHQRDPLEHFEKIKSLLKENGKVVIETLIIDRKNSDVLYPAQDTYAKMPNVYAVPTVEQLKMWIKESSFKDVQVVDVSTTTIIEQRQTSWMRFESLADFLNPKDHSQTIEGYPAPKRVILIAQKT